MNSKIKTLESILESLYQFESDNFWKIRLFELELSNARRDYRNEIENGKPNG